LGALGCSLACRLWIYDKFDYTYFHLVHVGNLRWVVLCCSCCWVDIVGTSRPVDVGGPSIAVTMRRHSSQNWPRTMTFCSILWWHCKHIKSLKVVSLPMKNRPHYQEISKDYRKHSALLYKDLKINQWNIVRLNWRKF